MFIEIVDTWKLAEARELPRTHNVDKNTWQVHNLKVGEHFEFQNFICSWNSEAAMMIYREGWHARPVHQSQVKQYLAIDKKLAVLKHKSGTQALVSS